MANEIEEYFRPGAHVTLTLAGKNKDSLEVEILCFSQIGIVCSKKGDVFNKATFYPWSGISLVYLG